MNSYKELVVWQKSIDLVEEIYNLTNDFPKVEIYGITNQMRRASVSIPSNISEGFARKHRQEYLQFLRIAFGSGAELETQLIISKRLGFIKNTKKADELLSEVMRMLNRLIASVCNPSG